MPRELAKIPPRKLSRTGRPQLPATITKAGERAGRRFIEFFTANIPQPQHALSLRSSGRAVF